MQFSDADLKMLEWLRKQHASWSAIRMIILVCSVLTMLLAVWSLFSRSGSDPAEIWLLYLVLAAGGMSYTLGSWAGRPEISLLLKLVEAQQANHEKP